MNGNSLIGGGPVTPNPGLAWKAIGTGDFNGDGHSDILFQNTTSGQVSIWEMNGNALIGGGPVSPNPGPTWQAIGTGDFNDDGRSDILFQNTSSGQVSIWEMNGNTLTGGGPVSPNPGPSWHAIGTGDFNGDGFSDILFQNASGQASIWEMNGNSLIGGGPSAPTPGRVGEQSRDLSHRPDPFSHGAARARPSDAVRRLRHAMITPDWVAALNVYRQRSKFIHAVEARFTTAT